MKTETKDGEWNLNFPTIPTDFPVLSCVQESLEDGPRDDTFGFMVKLSHLGNFRFAPGELFYFSTAKEAKLGDDVAVVLYRQAVDPTSREPVGYFEYLIIRKLVAANDMEVVLGPSPGMGNENEIISRDRIAGVYPWIASVFP